MNEKCVWKDGEYKASKLYAYVHRTVEVFPLYKGIWKSKCTMKIDIFGWLLIRERSNRRDMLQRRYWHVTDHTYMVCPWQNL
jgi:hypothetical protein